MELQILNEQMPIIEFNKNELMAILNDYLQRYESLIVTTETEKDAKKIRADLNKLETSIETFRKQTKKALNAPIDAFEKDCKALVDLIGEVKNPIDAQLKDIDAERREQKKIEVNEMIEKFIEEYELDAVHAEQLQILDKYLNKSESIAKIETDLKNRCEILKNSQLSYLRQKNIIKTTVDIYNHRLNKHLDAGAFISMFENGIDAAEVILKIHEIGKKAVNDEIDAVEQEAQQIMHEPTEEPIVHTKPMELCKEALEGDILTATLRFYGTKAQLKALKSCMESMGIKYEKVEV